MPEDHPHRICRCKIKSNTKLNYLYCKKELLYNNIFVFGGIYFENFKTEPFAGNAWFAKKVKVRSQNITKDASIIGQIYMPFFVCGKICTYCSFRTNCFPCLLAIQLISSVGISPFPSNGCNHKCARLISFGYESREFVFMYFKTENLFNANHFFTKRTNSERKT